ncbi:hypothetical protein [Naasia aerilata]|uniref:Uncharacterized protein n=1 Tax=Naasia aerilata TaxID=1162966 RepID=A0ABM8G8L9_9MICO|nr:hypothetical protein [Naasia aerilata]BDZ44541.1 hypothetical protein GCM10025866_04500 [Naasia aerilata]
MGAPDAPGGGSLWIRLPEPGANAFVQRAERYGVRLLPGTTFSSADQFDDHVRLSYADSPEVTRHGIELLSRVWQEWRPSMDAGDARPAI